MHFINDARKNNIYMLFYGLKSMGGNMRVRAGHPPGVQYSSPRCTCITMQRGHVIKDGIRALPPAIAQGASFT